MRFCIRFLFSRAAKSKRLLKNSDFLPYKDVLRTDRL